MPRTYPPEFRCKVLDPVASGRKVADVTRLLGIGDQTIYMWRRQHPIDTGQLAGTNSSDLDEQVAVCCDRRLEMPGSSLKTTGADGAPCSRR
ncbi:transposase [Streptomyces sp. NPDC001070]